MSRNAKLHQAFELACLELCNHAPWRQKGLWQEVVAGKTKTSLCYKAKKGAHLDVDAVLDHMVKEVRVVGQPNLLRPFAAWSILFGCHPHRPSVKGVLDLHTTGEIHVIFCELLCS